MELRVVYIALAWPTTSANLPYPPRSPSCTAPPPSHPSAAPNPHTSSPSCSLYPSPLSPRPFSPTPSRSSSPWAHLPLESRKHLERAAYLHFGPAQYKNGHVYEFAEPPWGFDPVLSVMYYGLANRAGEAEADMALSNWFLGWISGAATGDRASVTGGFEKDEALALVFAENAARKGLASAEFAMAYYAEAAAHGNTDAADRLTALSSPTAMALSRQEHDTTTEAKLTRRCTQPS